MSTWKLTKNLTQLAYLFLSLDGAKWKEKNLDIDSNIFCLLLICAYLFEPR